MQRALYAVALLALVCLLFRAARTGLAGDYVDPISHITAQDEALYAHSAITMAQNGDWLTPTFMGRLALYKPPLLIWLSAASARLLGVSRLALRFPIALLCSLAVGLVFLFAAELNSWQAGACAAALLASNHLWHVLGGSCMTDGILVALTVAAVYCLFADPWLESKAAFWGFSAAVAGAILTKSVAGLLPLGPPAARRTGIVLAGRAAPVQAHVPAYLPRGTAGPGSGLAVVPLSTRRARTLVSGGAHRCRNPGLWSRRPASDFPRKPRPVLSDAHGPDGPRAPRGCHHRPPRLLLRRPQALASGHSAALLDPRRSGLRISLGVPQHRLPPAPSACPGHPRHCLRAVLYHAARVVGHGAGGGGVRHQDRRPFLPRRHLFR
ncbi:membrane hypothetical protein [Candidatus Sulfopaludibacter sp. SbA3]|nr:membrane hypothetical protein [Candidatus Sulfopaludibacter sp. SbA3]